LHKKEIKIFERIGVVNGIWEMWEILKLTFFGNSLWDFILKFLQGKKNVKNTRKKRE